MATSSVSRNWFSGLSSGMDTQGLIDKLMSLERQPVDRLEQKRSVLSIQKSMLQDINLKLFETQNKATDLMFAKTFSTKKLTHSNEKLLTASANTSAKVGNQTVVIKQLATASKMVSQSRVTGSLELGHNIQSRKTVGGASLPLGNPDPGKTGLGITPGSIDIAVAGGGTHTINFTGGSDNTLSDFLNIVNGQISNNTELNGKVKASFDEQTNQVRFTLLDSTKTMTISDVGPGTVISTLYGAASIGINNNTPTKISTPNLIKSGTSVTLADLNVNLGTLDVTRDGNTQTLDLSSLSGSSTLAEAMDTLNHQLDQAFGWSGNPADRLSEFRYDSVSRKILFVNKSSADTSSLGLIDNSGDFVNRVFGESLLTSTNNAGNSLSVSPFQSNISSGTITIAGTQIIVNSSDTLQGVMSRITSSTNVNATYDSERDVIRLTRKDGMNAQITIGSSSDTSNFLNVTGLLTGSQTEKATKQTQGSVAVDPTLALENAGGLALATDGQLRFSVNGQVSTFSYAKTETLNGVLDRIKREVPGIGEAFYDAGTGKISISTSTKGSSASLKIEDISGTLATALDLDPTITASGLTTGTTLESSRTISGLKASSSLANAGFATPVTTGAFTINGVTFTVASTNMTLGSLLDSITNNTKAGVKAEYDSINGRIIMTSKTTGASSISFGSPTDSSNFLSAAGVTNGAFETGKNSVFVVKGFSGDAEITRSTNQVSDVIDGVTFNLKGVTDSNGETVTIDADTEVARKGVDDFIKSYNETMTMIYSKLTEKHDYEMEALTESQKASLTDEQVTAYEAQFRVGLLTGDTSLQSIRSRMRVVMSGMVSGLDKTMDALADIGITTGVVGSNYQDTQAGLLKITDSAKLDAALKDNPEKVAELFGRDSNSENSRGIARRLKDTLNEFTKSGGLLTKRVGRSGVAVSNSEFDKQISNLTTQISKQETRLKSREEALIKQFAELETAMSRYQSQSASLSQQLAKLG
jgi:flagellar hook-associated protein 2